MSPQPLYISLVILIYSCFLGFCVSILKDHSHCWMLSLSSAQPGIPGASAILLYLPEPHWPSLAVDTRPCYNVNLYFLLPGWPWKLVYVKKALDSNQEYSHMESTAQKPKSPAKHSLSPSSARSFSFRPLPTLPRILLHLCKLWGPKWVEQKQKTTTSFRRQNT